MFLSILIYHGNALLKKHGGEMRWGRYRVSATIKSKPRPETVENIIEETQFMSHEWQKTELSEPLRRRKQLRGVDRDFWVKLWK